VPSFRFSLADDALSFFGVCAYQTQPHPPQLPSTHSSPLLHLSLLLLLLLLLPQPPPPHAATTHYM
jgi:hypothetical protein